MQFLFGFTRPQQAAHPRQQHHFIGGLEQVILGARTQGAHPCLVVAQGCHDDHRDVARGRIGLEPFADRNAVDVGQIDIQKDQIGPFGMRQAQRLGAVGGLNGVIECGRQLDLKNDPVGRHIIDDEDLARHDLSALFTCLSLGFIFRP